jgi:hemolysin D
MPNSLNGRPPTQIEEDPSTGEGLSPAPPAASSDDWSYATQELLDTLPRPWTRGLLYFLLVFVSIALPWAMLYKVEETGTARGRMELKGGTVKQEADVAGAAIAVRVKEGDSVKAGDVIMELESKSVRDDIQQSQIKLEGQQNRLNQLKVSKNQLVLSLSSQQQQNKAQELEKLAQVSQARQTFDSLKTAYNLQKEEKLAQVKQAEQNLEHSQTAYNLAGNRLADAGVEVERYRKLWEDSVVAEIKVKEMEGVVKGRQQEVEGANSDMKQAKLRLEEQQESYRRTVHQVESDIEQAKLRQEEQENSYQSLIHAGELAVSKSEQQLNDLETQIAALQSEIAGTQTQIKSLKEQLNKYAIVAKKDGIIFQLPIQQPGAMVQQKQLIAEIAPLGTRLLFRGLIPTSETESLRDGKGGKDAKIKLDDYRVEDYGVVEGRLSWISPDSKLAETPQGQVASYEVEIELKQGCIRTPKECVPFRAGQTGTAEIIIRQRRIIDFVLDPFKKLQKDGLKL